VSGMARSRAQHPADPLLPSDRPASPFPRLRLRDPSGPLLDLPWALPLAAWPEAELGFRRLPVGPSRHLVRFLVRDGATFALKELPVELANREYSVLRQLEALGLPAVTAVGIAESPERQTAILVTEYLAHSLQYRRLLMRLPGGPGPYRDRLLDAMAWLLVDLHRSGVYWGDCSLANTLFRRDGDRIQAYLVDAETSEVHEKLSDGQRAYDLEVLVENVGFGLADLALMQGGSDDLDDAVAAAESVRSLYHALWQELTDEPIVSADERFEIRARIRRLNDLGFTVDEIELVPTQDGGRVRLRVVVTTQRFHVRELERLTGIVALEGQARLLLNDVREYRAWLEWSEKRTVDERVSAERWLRDVFQPTVRRLVMSIGPDRDPVQAYCDVLEHKWLLSEQAARDVGLEAAIQSYLASGAPAPEAPGGAAALDLDVEEMAADAPG
jgi:tRNA A-37 threonylcarbamoyl transferase component Bud32